MVNQVEKTALIKKFNEWIISVADEEVTQAMKLWLIAKFPTIVDEALPQKKGLFGQ